MDLTSGANLAKILMCFLGFLNFAGLIIIFVSNRMAFHKIMTNDLKHLDAKVDQFIEEGKTTRQKLNQVSEDVSYLKGIIDTVTLKSTRRRRSVAKKRKVRVSSSKRVSLKEAKKVAKKTKKKVVK